MDVPLEVVSDTLGHASIWVTMDVYGRLLAPSRMHAEEAMRRLWLDELPDFDPLATELATNLAEDDTHNTLNWDSVGRPGLNPGTLGLKVESLSSIQFCRVHQPSWSGVGDSSGQVRIAPRPGISVATR
jgi:hypothetical protein